MTKSVARLMISIGLLGACTFAGYTGPRTGAVAELFAFNEEILSRAHPNRTAVRRYLRVIFYGTKSRPAA